MNLSSELLSSFAKITKDKPESKKETIVYGTVQLDASGNSTNMIKIDGSSIETPLNTTVFLGSHELKDSSGNTIIDEHGAPIKVGDRVSGIIKDGVLIVTGNLSSNAARKIDTLEIENLNATNARVENLEVSNATILNTLAATTIKVNEIEAGQITAEDIEAEYAKISSLNVVDGKIETLNSDYGSFKTLTVNNFTSVNAAISGKLSARDIEGLYANIDFSNISMATIGQLFSESGIIQNIVVGEASITGRLVGVTISGDLIEANTLVANKLVVLGNDGLYYKLNTDGIKTEAQQTDQNSINGNVIKVKSITATKVNVTDLVAFGATIGGFKITNSALYSGSKASSANSTRGIYLDNSGQLNVGDASKFLKYTNVNGVYKLEIAADSVILGSNNKNIETEINNAQSGIGNLGSRVSSVESNITLLGGRITSNASETTSLGNRISTVEQTASSLSVRLTTNENNTSTAQSTANSANTNALNAAKTATNYLRYDANGLLIANLTGTLGENVLIKSTGVDIRDGTNVLASFGPNLIELGKNSVNSIIQLCGNKGQIKYDGTDEYLDITGNTLRLKANSVASLYSLYNNENIGYKSAVNVNNNSIDIYSQDSTTLVNGVGIWRTSQLEISPERIYCLTDKVELYGRYGIDLETVSGNININTTNVKSSRSLKILWSGVQYMFSGQSANLSESVSSQLTGIVLHWQQYASGEAQNAHHVYSFVPKSHVVLSPGGGVGFFLTNATGAYVGTKYVYVNNNSLAGHEANDDNTTNVDGGITTKNNFWVLTQVLGV